MKVTITTSTGSKIKAIINGNEATVGRSANCEIVVPDESLSRRHCKIELQAGNFFVTDLSSANGVYIDNTKIEANVRTPFSSYNQLNLGQLDCQVEDSDQKSTQDSTPPSPQERHDSKPAVTQSNKKLIKVSGQRPPRPAASTRPNKLSMGLILPAVVIIGIIMYFATSEKDTALDSVTSKPVLQSPPAYKKRLEVAKIVPNEFRATQDYTELSAKKSCRDMMEHCSSMKIDEAHNEGFAREPGEYFVFLNPARWLSDERYLSIKDHKEAMDLIVFDHLISSSFFDEFIFERTLQISVVINDSSGKPLRVYRFHTLNFPAISISRLGLMEGIQKALADGNPQLLLDLLKNKVLSKDLTL